MEGESVMSMGVGFGRPIFLSFAIDAGSGRCDEAVGRRLRLEVGWSSAELMTWLVSPGVAVSVAGGLGVAGRIIVVSAGVGRLAGVEIKSWLFCRSVCLTTVVRYGFGTFSDEDFATLTG
ncbi:hypothetical protein QQ045_023545 [Rhodiola kirilowii]